LVWPLVRSLPKILLPTPLKAQWKQPKVPKQLLKAQWKPLKALQKQPAKPLLLLVMPLLLVPPPLATLLLLPVTPLPLQRKKQPSKFTNLLSVWGRHPQGWRPFPFRQCSAR
jgi:hypothetical protein